MDPTGPNDDGTSVALCPLEVLSDVVDAFVASTRIFADELSESPLIPLSLGRSLSSAVEANGTLVKQLFRVSPRLDRSWPGRRRWPEEETARAVVLTAKAGTEASGIFALQNQRPEAVRATILSTAFVDAAGEQVAVDLRLEPGRVMLEPGEEVEVSISATVPADLAPGQHLRGAVLVPDLTASAVAVVIQSGMTPRQRPQVS